MEAYLGVLQEIGNIGVGNAATALAELIGTKVLISVPQATFVPLEGIFNVVGDAEEPVAGVLVRVGGEIRGTVLFAFSASSATELVRRLIGEEFPDPFSLTPEAASVLQEIGNILTGAFLTAISDFTGLTFVPDVPFYAYDMLGSIVSTSLVAGEVIADRVLLFETEFMLDSRAITAHFFLFLTPPSLATLLKSLGLAAENL
ncbi:CheC, inhibitor of MCP methylation [Ammonifex degensii KC4]|uniref:CheC, inhibitor of MCP methylation n=1 Tax=Ammonifex degensii (strain DSM 10501 / KC4) TaxID=429009 RepID=C9R9W9_AMMDK|nr:chemotaxis protein CheC [Ammonifex degensii]ACX53098.1 CheC, inhibitor of MCP methylation [Ammonifex degensii KC4]